MAKLTKINGKTFLLEGGKAYEVTDKSVEVKTKKAKGKTKLTLEDRYNKFIDFMANLEKNYKPVSKPIDTKFKRKDGKTIPVKQVKMSNGKTYNISAFRVWTV